MFVWGVLITSLIVLAMLPYFLGLLIVRAVAGACDLACLPRGAGHGCRARGSHNTCSPSDSVPPGDPHRQRSGIAPLGQRAGGCGSEQAAHAGGAKGQPMRRQAVREPHAGVSGPQARARARTPAPDARLPAASMPK